MPQLTNTSESVRINQALEVLSILAGGNKSGKNKVTIDKACEQVGITPRQYRYWIRRSNEAIEVFHEALRELERAELSNILIARQAIQELVIQDGLSKYTDPMSRLTILRYLETRADELSERHRSTKDAGDLLSGPQLVSGESRFSPGAGELEVVQEQGQVIVRTKKPEIVDGEFAP